MNVGFVGLGNIGGPCVRHLIDAGHRVAVFDIDEAAVSRLVGAGALGAASAADAAAASDAVLLSLPTPEASEAVVAQETLEAEAGFAAPIPPEMDGPWAPVCRSRT